MTPQRWRRVRELFDAAIELAEGERRAFIERSCAGDSALREELVSLLRAHQRPATILEQPALCLASPAPPPDDVARQIGPYRLERLLGSGGMSAVYLATRTDQAYRQQVAVKLLKWGFESDDSVRRFRTERQILADLDHPNVTRLLDGGVTEDGRPYLVMELVDGTPIDVYCDRHRLPLEVRLSLFRKVCAAVQFAHQSLVVHRDIKPGNILVDGRGEPKLLDFGIAKLLAGPPAETTHYGLRPMTPAYASPEQLAGAPITTASDVYSLGVVLYELLAGRLPHPQGLEERLEALAEDREPEAPSTAADGGGVEVRRLAGDLDAIVTRALRRRPGERYPSVEQLVDDLERFEHGLPVRARAGTLGYRVGKFVRRYRIAVGLAAGFFVFLVAAALTFAMMATRVARERDKAEQVAGFMIELFEVADPEVTRGDSVTVREVLDRGAVSISERLADQPEVLAAMLYAIGRVYKNLGLSRQAAPLLRESWRLRSGRLGEDHPDALESLKALARVTEDLGDVPAARTLYFQLLDHQRRLWGEDVTAVADTLMSLARFYQYDGDFDRAEDFARQALGMAVRIHGEHHESVVAARHALALIYRGRGDFDAAELEFRRALSLGRRIRDLEDPLMLPVLKGFADVLSEKGDFHEAEKIYREILDIEHRVFGDRHPRVAYSLNHLGGLMLDLGNLEAAEPLIREGLEIRQELYGTDHMTVAVSTFSLGEVYRHRRRWAEAEELYRRSLEITREKLPPGNLNLAYPLVGLARTRTARGDFTAAEPLLREALAIRRQALPEDSELIRVTEEELERCVDGRAPQRPTD